MPSQLKCNRHFLGMALVAVLSLTGCHVGPDYRRPAAPVSHQWIDADEQPDLIGQCESPSDWWNLFNDPDLTSLIHATHNQNLGLKSAGMRIAESRSRLGIAEGNRFPQLQEMFGAYSRNGLSKNSAFVPPSRFYDSWSTGFDAAWELDFWGRFSRAIESAGGEYNATIEDYDAILVSILGEVGATYVQLRTFQQRLEFARNNLEIQQSTLKLAQARFEQGATSELDVKQAQSNVSQTEALIPVLETGVRQANNALCVLTGIPPRDLLLQDISNVGPIPVGPSNVALGVPADLIRQRPDVRAVERRLAAQSARIGIATTDLYPRIALTGTVGLQAQDFSDLFSSGSFNGVVGPSFTWNILNYGRLKNNIRAQEAIFQQLAYEYQQAVIQAQREVEDALVAFQKSQRQVKSLQDSVKASEGAVDIGTKQYRLGKVDFNRVFLLQTELVRQQDLLASAQGDQARNLIAIYKSLGGGWQIRFQNGQPPAFFAEPTLIEDSSSLPMAVEQSETSSEAISTAGDENGKQSNRRDAARAKNGELPNLDSAEDGLTEEERQKLEQLRDEGTDELKRLEELENESGLNSPQADRPGSDDQAMQFRDRLRLAKPVVIRNQ